MKDETVSAKPERPFSLTARTNSVSLSRFGEDVFLNTFGTVSADALLELLQGITLVPVEDWRWRVGSEADARRVMTRLVESWPEVSRLEVSLAREGLPGVCLFWFELKAGDEVSLMPELERHRDEQRARVPQAEVWLEQVLQRAVDAKPVWTSEWRITRAQMNQLLAGPMDPFS
ncbi:MAG: hypothetical protein ABTQ32_25595 [Myxococcaceae bacterium]